MKKYRYYDLVASVCNDYCRTDCYLICGGFHTKEDAIDYINKHDISEVDYYKYCKDGETAYIEIEEHDSLSGAIVDVVTVD